MQMKGHFQAVSDVYTFLRKRSLGSWVQVGGGDIDYSLLPVSCTPSPPPKKKVIGDFLCQTTDEFVSHFLLIKA